jgi:hypothetical protein
MCIWPYRINTLNLLPPQCADIFDRSKMFGCYIAKQASEQELRVTTDIGKHILRCFKSSRCIERRLPSCFHVTMSRFAMSFTKNSAHSKRVTQSPVFAIVFLYILRAFEIMLLEGDDDTWYECTVVAHSLLVATG